MDKAIAISSKLSTQQTSTSGISIILVLLVKKKDKLQLNPIKNLLQHQKDIITNLYQERKIGLKLKIPLVSNPKRWDFKYHNLKTTTISIRTTLLPKDRIKYLAVIISKVIWNLKN